jgi:uncharacterized damage-inducible protein DinB
LLLLDDFNSMKGKAVTEELSTYTSRAARALVLLHEKHLRQCVEVWKQAKVANLKLPVTDDERYQSLETLLGHILGAARRYMLWICKSLKLPDPKIRPVPEVDKMEAEVDLHLEYLLERWRLPLANLEEEKLYNPEYSSNGGTHHHCIDIMLEHALTHPLRHEFQLRELLESEQKVSSRALSHLTP